MRDRNLNSQANQTVLVLDFGGQYKELIARTVREQSVYSEIVPGNITAEEIRRINPIGIILTGGPESVHLPDSSKCTPELFEMGIPVMGICYGMQMMCHMLGGVIETGAGEYGRIPVGEISVLMSHRDSVTKLPDGFTATMWTNSCIAACEDTSRKLYGVQFHPESSHTDGGSGFIRKFLYEVCGAVGDYTLDDYIQTQISLIRRKVGTEKVLLGLSGGVDSSVCAALLSEAIGEQLICIFVDHGFMRLNEGDEIERAFADRQLRFIRVNAQNRFIEKMAGVSEPESKRKIIGEEFIRVFEEEAAALGNVPFLAQGTIYPDIVESGGKTGATIKSHHNVGGLPESLTFAEIIEPLAGLFKDEVRILGGKLGLPTSLSKRQPFPGPGLAVRIMGEITPAKLELVRKSDAILREELEHYNPKPDQYFTVLTNTYSVGVKGDDRTYDYVVALRAVTTSDFMTCEYTPVPHEILGRISSRITNEIPGVSRVVYDITSKPPGTIEWE
ncbi:MAG: glutamine-hydrolyzing GMP synthase [Oscillospiraceae bacterium]|nr:glutamine-hydrolyzing GMP synthase [Oscillospiraceae bacterium]